MISRVTMLLALLLSSWLFLLVTGLGVQSNKNGKAEVFRVVGVAGGTQFLPAAYVNTFQRWQIDPDGNKLTPITGSCFADGRINGGDDGSGTAPNISIQPTLNFLIKGGAPAYALVGLLAATKSDASSSETSPVLGSSSNTNHLAQQWTTFATAAEPNFRIELFLGPGDGTDDRMGVVGSQAVNEAVERLGLALSQTDSAQFASGFHLVTLPVKMEMSSRTTETETQESQQDQATDSSSSSSSSSSTPMMLTCVATAEMDARELLTLDDSLLELTATSKLDMEAAQVLTAV